MSPRIAGATARRVLRQVRHDPRTVALLVLVPVVLMTLMKWVLDAQPAQFQRVGVPLLGIFPLVSMFLVTSVTMLRERTTGTLERLMTMPIGRLDLLVGYAVAFALLAVVQGTVVSLVAFGVLGLDSASPAWAVIALAVANALLGVAMGLFLSAFARSEFQAVQFMPGFLLPQLLLCGLLGPREGMARPLELLSNVLPMSYAYDALQHVAREPGMSAGLAGDAAVIAGATVLSLALGAVTLRRRTP